MVWGNANGAGEDNRNVGRMAVLLAGLPVTVPATTVNRLCGSSLDAAMIGSRTIESGDADVVVAGGVESMTRAPWVLPKPSRAFPAGDASLVSTTLGWRLVNERMQTEWTVSLGEANEQLQERFADLPRAAGRVRRPLAPARRRGVARGLLRRPGLAVAGSDLTRDESIRADSTPENLAGLRPSFRPDGTITAGNASPLNDGASALLLGSETAAERIGRAPLARIAGRGVSALEPQAFGYRPDRGRRPRPGPGRDRLGGRRRGRAQRGLRRAVAGLRRRLGDRPRPSSTPRVARSHRPPAGCFGRHGSSAPWPAPARDGGRWGVAAICIGVGQALAVVLENVS